MDSDSDDELYLEALKEKAKQILNMNQQPADAPSANPPKPKKKKEQTEEAKAKTLQRLQELRERSRANKGLTLTPDSMKPKRVYTKPIEKPVEPIPPPPQPTPQPITQPTQSAPPPQPNVKSYFIPKSKYNMKTFGF
jgi:hypothetical protein